jgi:hypothetical protein
MGALLWIGGMFAVLGLLYDGWGPAVLIGMVAAAVIGGGHCLLQRVLRRQGVPRPWEFSTVISTALVLAVVQMSLTLFLDVENAVPLPLTCLLLSVPGALVVAVLRHRHRFVFALVLVAATSMLMAGGVWQTAIRNHEREHEQLLRDIADFPLPIAVLDSPGWEPSGVRVIDNDVQRASASIAYVPVDPSPELDGFGLTLRSESLDRGYDSGWTPLYELCDLEGGPWACDEYGDTVIAADSHDEVEFMEARTEFTDGVAAELMTDMPNDSEGNPAIDFPDIDMAELSEHIREAEPGEVEEIASSVAD